MDEKTTEKQKLEVKRKVFDIFSCVYPRNRRPKLSMYYFKH
jgi:hypothetical protein